MVKAELSYNPYLLETIVKFNGKSPRINSLVEKYQEGSLQRWVDDIPSIFHDEMNGYDFELDFSGTDLDYADLKAAFDKAGITREKVELFHRNTLSGREEKVHSISGFLDWLEGTPNRKLNYDQFKSDNSSLYDFLYPVVMIQGMDMDISMFEGIQIKVELVSRVQELKDTNLENIPVIFYLDEESIKLLQQNLRAFRQRADVEARQLFFLINPSMNQDAVIRIIKDLGIVDPQIITSTDYGIVKKYLELYPISKYIYTSIQTLRECMKSIDDVLQAEKEESEVTNREVHKQINSITYNIDLLKNAKHNFETRNKIEMPQTWKDAVAAFDYSVANWRIHNTKTNKEGDAIQYVYEYDKEIQKYYAAFLERIDNAIAVTRSNLENCFETWYENAKNDLEYQVYDVEMEDSSCGLIPEIYSELMKLKKEEWVTPQDDIFTALFRKPSTEPKEPVLETTYSFKDWREYAWGVIEPIITKYVDECFEKLSVYEKALAEKYIEHITALIIELEDEKANVSAQLSDDEKKLQVDLDWLEKYADQLMDIERG